MAMLNNQIVFHVLIINPYDIEGRDQLNMAGSSHTPKQWMIHNSLGNTHTHF